MSLLREQTDASSFASFAQRCITTSTLVSRQRDRSSSNSNSASERASCRRVGSKLDKHIQGQSRVSSHGVSVIKLQR